MEPAAVLGRTDADKAGPQIGAFTELSHEEQVALNMMPPMAMHGKWDLIHSNNAWG